MAQEVIQLPLEKIKCDKNQIRSGELDEQELIGLAITIREADQQARSSSSRMATSTRWSMGTADTRQC